MQLGAHAPPTNKAASSPFFSSCLSCLWEPARTTPPVTRPPAHLRKNSVFKTRTALAVIFASLIKSVTPKNREKVVFWGGILRLLAPGVDEIIALQLLVKKKNQPVCPLFFLGWVGVTVRWRTLVVQL